jgi:DNA-binding NarL/FixJ family response regulator
MKEKRAMPRVRLGLVAGDPLRILGMQTIFEQAGDMEVVPLSVPGALEQDFSLVLIDAHCTDHLVELVSSFRLNRPQTRLLVMGSSMEPDYIQQVIGAGAKGYLSETAGEQEIKMAIEVVLDGSVWAPRKVLARLIDAGSEVRQRNAALNEIQFTPRERDVLELLTAGGSNREIARSLGITEVGVKAHVGRLLRKVGVTNRISLSVHILASNVAIQAAPSVGARQKKS